MKKILALLMAITLIFAFSACGKNNSSDNLSSTVAGTEFQKPEGYAAVLLVTINPKFELYLDAKNEVMAINAVNDDAKSFKDEIDLSAPALDAVIDEILSAANKKGFVNADKPEISFEVSEVKVAGISESDILSKATSAANKAADALKLGVTVNTSSQATADTESQNTLSADSSKPASDGVSSETSSKNTSSPRPDESSSEPHVHLYTPANCTKPATCACGKTDGKALGHMWDKATCKAPKTCHICKVTEGAVGEHDYKDGKCTVCGVSNYLNPKTSLKLTEEYVAQKYFVYDATSVYAPGVSFYNDGGYGEGVYCIMMEAMFTSEPDADIKDRTPITYNGKKYYRCGAGQSPAYVELTDTEIIITQNSDTVKMVLMADGNLKITASTISDFPVDTVLSISWNYLK